MITGPVLQTAVLGIPSQPKQQKENKTTAVNELPSADHGHDGNGHRRKDISIFVLLASRQDSPPSPSPCVNVLKLIKGCDDGISKPTSPISLPLTHLMSGYVTR